MGIRALGLKPGDEILTPAYHHGSEIEALMRAGIVCRFYDIGHRLEPNREELDALLGPRVRALHLTHFLGFPQNAARWRAWCDERDLLLIEDAAQAWLSSREGVPVGSHGDLSLFCLYKTFGLSDGAAVLCRRAPDPPRQRSPLRIDRVIRYHAIYLEQRWGWLAEIHRRLKGAREYDPNRDFALGDPTRAPNMGTIFLVPRVTNPQAQGVRLAHYAFLLERLGRLVPEPFAHLHEGASPYAFPIQSRCKSALLGRLYRHGIVASNFWSVPHPSLKVDKFPQAAALRESVVALPVHQEMGTEELERVVAAVH
jgi:dTDP-4-amino-4,6-dideoxygalactose transaminase